MAKKRKEPAGAVGKGGVNAAPTEGNHTVRVAAEQLLMVPVDDLVPYANNAKMNGLQTILRRKQL